MKEDKIYNYYLPSDSDEGSILNQTNCNSIIIIGANGSGKSKLGAWMEDNDPANIHRIGGQRNLNFETNIPLKNMGEARNIIIYGTDEENHVINLDKRSRWGWDGDSTKTTQLLDDFNVVLAALIAMFNNETAKFFNDSRSAEIEGNSKPKTCDTVIDKLMDIWDSIFPHRELLVYDSKFFAKKREEGSCKYSANKMSDGERAVLYLVSLVLVLPENITIIIDEPEVHLHNSIMYKLWDKLEKYRKDCLFIYITHDTEFAAYHKNSEKIWIQEFDGKSWKFQKVDGRNLPNKLLFDILGSRKDVLFVEGDQNSKDIKLYSLIYPNYFIVPCEGCSQVIFRTKAFNNLNNLHNFSVYGIVDRDFRSDEEIEYLKDSKIFVLSVAEIENLLITEEVIKLICDRIQMNYDDVFKKIKEYIINDRFKNQMDSQVKKAVVSELKFKLSRINIEEDNLKESLENEIQKIQVNDICIKKQRLYEEALEKNNYREIIKLFNEKSIINSIGNFFDFQDSKYSNRAISIIESLSHSEIMGLFENYIPTENQLKND